jgi:hypothetical protein
MERRAFKSEPFVLSLSKHCPSRRIAKKKEMPPSTARLRQALRTGFDTLTTTMAWLVHLKHLVRVGQDQRNG